MVGNTKTPSSLSPLLLKYLRLFESDKRSRVFAPLAEVYRKMGMLDKAIATCKEGIKHNPSYVLGHLCYAQCMFEKNQKQLTYEILRPFVKTNRDNLALQKLFAKVALDINEKEEALDTYKYLLFVNPKDLEARKMVEVLEDEATAPIIVKDKTNTNKSTFEELDPDEWVIINSNTTSKNLESSLSADDWIVGNDKKIEKQAEEREINFKNNARVENRPLITHTLVDLYCQQGFSSKAIEILEQILIETPSDERTIERLKLLRSLENSKTQNIEEDGHAELLGLFDKATSEKDMAQNFDKRTIVKNKLLSFLEALQNRSKVFKNIDSVLN